ncbi:MAG: glutamine synthetase III, partial [Limnochordia bacterium]
MRDVPKLFGSMVFNDETMQARLPEDVYLALKKSMAQGTHLELDVANAVANAMKEWAIEKGATHFTHWFQPMTGIT